MTEAPIAIIPVAGTGTRLRPHTFTQPKVLLNVAGKPILAYILDELPGLGVREVVLIVGYMGERVRDYVAKQYPDLLVHYVDQPERLGLGHAVALAEPFATGRAILIILGDTIFEADLPAVLARGTSAIGVKSVEDPRRFGIVELNGAGRIMRMVEKPEHPASNLAITGVYFFADGTPLFQALRELQREGVRTRGEFQLTDGMQRLIDRGAILTTFPIQGWHDCGELETLLETHRVLLDRRTERLTVPGSVVHPPSTIADGAVVRGAIVGPYVSIAAGATVRNAVLRNAIVNGNATVEDVLLEDSVVGENAVIRGKFRRVNVGDSSEIHVS